MTVQPGSLQTLAACKDNLQEVDLLLTDQTMPDMTGTQLAQHVLAMKNFMPIILCTGFSETITEENASNFGIAKLLMKPINLEELATAVHSVLKASRPETENRSSLNPIVRPCRNTTLPVVTLDFLFLPQVTSHDPTT
jgi:DNA-binding NtrC family response regulator